MTEASDFPSTPGVIQPKNAGGSCEIGVSTGKPPGIVPCGDAFVIKLDPKGNVVFATLLGGNGMDAGTSIAVDSAGNIYVAGLTQADTHGEAPVKFPVTPGAYDTQPTGDLESFVAKLNASGTALIYSTLVPAVKVQSIAVDAAGEVILGGAANEGSFIGRLNPAGSALEFSSNIRPQVAALTIDAVGNIYIAGIAASFELPPGAVTLGDPQTVGGFVEKLGPDGSVAYAAALGGAALDSPIAIRVDAAGSAYVLGIANSTDFPVTQAAFQTSPDAPQWASPAPGSFGSRHFLSKLAPDGSAVVYSTFLTDANALDVDSSGHAFVISRASYGFPATRGATQRCSAGGSSDVLISEFNPDGSLAAASYLGGSGIDGAALIPQGVSFNRDLQAIAVGADGSVYVAGATNSTDFAGAQGQTVTALSSFVSRLQIADASKLDAPCIALALSNSASFGEGPIAPGELVTLRGMGMGPDTGAVMPAADQVGTALAGVQVFFDGVAAPILYAQSEYINVQAPFELAGPTTNVRVQYNSQSSNAAVIPVAPGAPAVFHLALPSSQAVVLNEDGTLNSASNPAPRGSAVALWGTGGGLLSPSAATGGFSPLDPLERITQEVHVRLGQIPQTEAEVLYAGSAPTLSSGVFQINFRIPETLPPSSRTFVTVTIGHAASSDPAGGTTIAVK